MGHSASAMLSWIATGVPRIIYEYDLIYVVAMCMIDDTFWNLYSITVCSISPVTLPTSYNESSISIGKLFNFLIILDEPQHTDASCLPNHLLVR